MSGVSDIPSTSSKFSESISHSVYSSSSANIHSIWQEASYRGQGVTADGLLPDKRRFWNKATSEIESAGLGFNTLNRREILPADTVLQMRPLMFCFSHTQATLHKQA